MGKMSEIAFLLESGDEKGLVEFFGNYGWKKSVSEIGGSEFLKAFEEIKEAKKKTMTINEMNDVIKSTPEYKLGKKLLNGEISNVTIDNIIDNESGVE